MNTEENKESYLVRYNQHNGSKILKGIVVFHLRVIGEVSLGEFIDKEMKEYLKKQKYTILSIEKLDIIPFVHINESKVIIGKSNTWKHE